MSKIIYIERKTVVSDGKASKGSAKGVTTFIVSTFKCNWVNLQGVILEPGHTSTAASGKGLMIPVGEYNLVKHSGSNRTGVYKLYNSKVSQGRAILLHEGTTVANTEGCLLVAKSWGGSSLVDSPLYTSILTGEIAKAGGSVKVIITAGRNPSASVGSAAVSTSGNTGFDSKGTSHKDQKGSPDTRTDVGGSSGSSGSSSSTPKVDISGHMAVKAADIATSRALPKSVGRCAQYWRIAHQQAGFKFTPHPSAFQYVNTMSSLGYEKINKPNVPQKGDTRVLPAHGQTSGGGGKHGHIEVWNGSNWVSDYIAKGGANSLPNSYYKKVESSITYWRHKDILNGGGDADGGGSSSGGIAGMSSINLQYNPDEAMQKANEAAKAQIVDPKTALAAIQDLPTLLRRRATMVDAMNKGAEIKNFVVDINTETEIEAALNTIAVGATTIPGMEGLGDGSIAYSKGDSKNLIERVYPSKRYINPFYYELFKKDFHKDINVRPLYFWPQRAKITLEQLTAFDAPSFYQTLHNNSYKSFFFGKEVDATQITEQLSSDAKKSKNNDDHTSNEAMFQMLETRYIKEERGKEKKYSDMFNMGELFAELAMKMGVPAVLATGLGRVLGSTLFAPLQMAGGIVGWVADTAGAVGDAVDAAGEFLAGNTVTNYTGEFPQGLAPAGWGSLQDSKKDSIGVGYPAPVRAFMDFVSRCEGTHSGVSRAARGYQDYYGHKRILKLNEPHPDVGYPYGKGVSDAAGRYQMMGKNTSKTWRAVWGGKNEIMSIKNQDEGFVKLVKMQAGTKSYDALYKGDWVALFNDRSVRSTSAGRKLRTNVAYIWASIPALSSGDQGAYGGQKFRGLTQAKAVQLLAHLTKFYEGAKADGTEKVKVDGPNVISRAATTVAEKLTDAVNSGTNKSAPGDATKSTAASVPARKGFPEFFGDKKARNYIVESGGYYRNKKTGQWNTHFTFTKNSSPPVDKDTKLVSPLPGSLTIAKNGNQRWVATVETDVKGLVIKYMGVSPDSIRISAEGKKKAIKAGEEVALINKTATGSYEISIQVLYNNVPLNIAYTQDLSKWPIKSDYTLSTYLDAKGFTDTADNKTLVSEAEFVKLHSNGSAVSSDPTQVTGGQAAQTTLTPDEQYTYEQMRGHQYEVVKKGKDGSPLEDGATVFSATLTYTHMLRNFIKPFEYANSQMLPQIKGYTVIGNEDDDYYVEGVPIRQPIVYEMPPIQSFSLACNNDYNPVDVIRFVVVNPAHLISMPQYFDYSKSGNIKSMHTQFFNPSYMDKARIRAGTRVSFKIGYTNNPNFNPTVFNGVIKEVGGSNDYLLECIAEGFGAELLSTEIASAKPINYTNGHNASTGALFGISLLDEAISHFGARIGSWRYAKDFMTGIFRHGQQDEFSTGAEWQNDTIFEGKGRIGDMRDPENKALVAPWSWGDNIFNLWFPTRANAAHRAYVNIFSDVIESVHDNFSTDFARSWLALLKIDQAAAWRYFAYKSSPWSIMKEMEYRHPGTLCKPLNYDERMTLFYGIPFQNYIAKDLSPHFMTSAALANRWESLANPYTDTYLQIRASRMEAVTNYHLLHSDLNIISNGIKLSRDFYTRVNVSEFNRTFEPGDPGMGTEEHQITLDDNLAAHEIRTKSLALGGCHKEYNAWLYGTTELKKEVEKMYTGQIIVVGNPHIKAGDYAHLEDRIRGLSGTIKIRECEHHITEDDGYITIITPGLWAEPSQFSWSNHLQVFSTLGRYVSDMVSEVSADDLMERLVGYQAIAIAAASHKNKTESLSDILLSAGFTTAFGLWGSRAIYKKVRASRFGRMTTGRATGYARAFAHRMWNTVKGYASVPTSSITNSTWMQKITGKISTVARRWRFVRHARVMGRLLMRSRFARFAAPALRVAFTVGRGALAVVGGALASTPVIGWLVVGLIEAVLSFVTYKLDKNRLTRQPIVFVPIMYNHGPYIAGVDGFINNTFLESMWYNMKQTWKSVSRAGQYWAQEHGFAMEEFGNTRVHGSNNNKFAG